MPWPSNPEQGIVVVGDGGLVVGGVVGWVLLPGGGLSVAGGGTAPGDGPGVLGGRAQGVGEDVLRSLAARRHCTIRWHCTMRDRRVTRYRGVAGHFVILGRRRDFAHGPRGPFSYGPK